LFTSLGTPCSWKVTRQEFNNIVAATKNFQEDSLQFMSKVLFRSGLGDETYAPPSKQQSIQKLGNTANKGSGKYVRQ
jgi:hypothetical protein